MVRIRLQRAGAKRRPFYRIVAIDSRRQRDGRALEFLGSYDPTRNPERIVVKRERVQAWLGQGAQLSDTVKSLLKRAPAETEAKT